MTVKTEYLESCIGTLKMSLAFYQDPAIDENIHLLAMCTIAKNYELSLELAGKLLRKALSAYHASPRFVSDLPYKEVLREAAKYQLIGVDAIERWFKYRDYRNTMAHDYGLPVVESVPDFIDEYLDDVMHLIEKIKKVKG